MKRRAAVLAVAGMLGITSLAFSSQASAATSCTSYSHVNNSTGWVTEVPSVGYETDNFNCILGVGNNSVAVTALQNNLNDCYLGPAGKTLLSLDGDFGAKTKAALVYAQGKAGAVQDGVYGPETRDKIKWTAHKGASYCGRVAF